MVSDRLAVVRNTLAFDDHVADGFNYPAIDPAVVTIFQLQHSADFGELRRDVRSRHDAGTSDDASHRTLRVLHVSGHRRLLVRRNENSRSESRSSPGWNRTIVSCV